MQRVEVERPAAGPPKRPSSPQVSWRPVEACNEAIFDRVRTHRENDWHRGGCGFGGQRRRCTAVGEDQRHLVADEIVYEKGKTIYSFSAEQYSISTFCPSTNPTSLRPWRNASTKSVTAPAHFRSSPISEHATFDLKLPGTGRSDTRSLFARRALAKRFPGYSQRRFCILIHKSPAPA